MCPDYLPALSVRQPWAAMIACGRKTEEYRSWQTLYRGPLVIVASRTRDVAGPEDLQAGLSSSSGQTVALVDLVGVRRTEQGWAWRLEHPRVLRPVQVRGRLGLFHIPAALAVPAEEVACPNA